MGVGARRAVSSLAASKSTLRVLYRQQIRPINVAPPLPSPAPLALAATRERAELLQAIDRDDKSAAAWLPLWRHLWQHHPQQAHLKAKKRLANKVFLAVEALVAPDFADPAYTELCLRYAQDLHASACEPV